MHNIKIEIMNELTPQQALANVRLLIDTTVQKGLFANANDVLMMITSYNILVNAVDQLNKKE